jgi:type I restriction enzyme S subunit
MSAVAAERDDTVDADEPWSLPEWWAQVKLKDVVERLTDGTHLPPKFTDSGIPFIVIGNITNDAIDWKSVRKWVSNATYEIESKRLKPRRDDILYTAVGSYGHAVRISDDRDFMFQRHIAYVRPNSAAIDPGFLCYALNSPALQRQAHKAARGVAQKTVTLGSLRDFVLPLAPLPEQRRIVARIDELFAEIAEGEAALKRARSGLDIWRRALLKAAVTGELTRDWREANEPTETGYDLLNQLRTSRSRTGLEISSLPTLPDGWAWGSFDDLIETLRNGTSIVPTKEVTQNRILRISSVRPLAVDATDYRHLDDAAATTAEEFKARPGDLLLTRYNGSRRFVGVCGVFRGETPIFYPDKIIRARLHSLITDLSNFVEAALNTGVTRKFIEREIKTTAGQHGISGSALKAVPVPIPPLEEGIFIGTILNAELSRIDSIENETHSQIAVAALRQSILKSAFEGHLLPQDPSDEPASMLLARLRAEASAPRRARGRKTAS